jgi:hypothetical protein
MTSVRKIELPSTQMLRRDATVRQASKVAIKKEVQQVAIAPVPAKRDSAVRRREPQSFSVRLMMKRR